MYKMDAVKKGTPIEYKIPTPLFYEALGYEGMKDLMDRFYDEVYDSTVITHFFPQDEEEFNKVKERNTLFFIQLCGGPRHYENEKDLNAYIISMHSKFSIYEKHRYEWLGCMEIALRDTKNISQELKDDFWNYLEKFSKHTVNTSTEVDTFYLD